MTTRKTLLWAVLAVGLALGVCSAAVVGSPGRRTAFYFGLERQWDAHWPFDGGKTLYARLRPVLEPFVPVRVLVEPGVNMLLDPDDSVSRAILETGVWEPETWQAIAERLQPGGTFVDVGAHIGYYSLKAAKIVGPAGRVIAVEPNPETLRRLRDNLRASRAAVVRVQPVACADSETTLEFFASLGSNTGGSSLARASASRDTQPVRAYQVRARPLDAIVEEAGLARVDVVKIDTEGAELSVLKGAKRTLARYRPVVIAELWEGTLKAMGTSPAEVVEFLRSQGYTVGRTFSEYSNTEFVPDKAPAQSP